MIKAILIIFAVCFLLYLSICVRIAVAHPIKTLGYMITDVYSYIRYRKWRNCTYIGKIVCYVGLFGKGKTLSAVHQVVRLYKKYNDLTVYDSFRKKWVTQKIKIISNVELVGIPYEKFISLSQLVSVSRSVKTMDEMNDTKTITIALGDEFSVQLNSRQFRSNIDPLFLNTLLTCRHHGISLIYTTQRFQHCDKLLREVTSYVISCDKVWRFQTQKKFDAYEMENATSPSMVKPLARFGWFVTNKDYGYYNTLACVDNLAKSCEEGDMLSETDILALQCNIGADNDSVENPTRKLKKLRKTS